MRSIAPISSLFALYRAHLRTQLSLPLCRYRAHSSAHPQIISLASLSRALISKSLASGNALLSDLLTYPRSSAKSIISISQQRNRSLTQSAFRYVITLDTSDRHPDKHTRASTHVVVPLGARVGLVRPLSLSLIL